MYAKAHRKRKLIRIGINLENAECTVFLTEHENTEVRCRCVEREKINNRTRAVER